MSIPARPHAALVLVGPTAVGKTAVALDIAQLIPAEIISADSRQIYRFMDIGTAKPTQAQLAQVPHHFINCCDPDEHYSAGRFGYEARQTVQQILARQKLPLIVGGSGFYLRALLEGFSPELPTSLELREHLRHRAAQEGAPALHAELRGVDQESAKRLHPNDTQRIVRALEVYQLTGSTLTELWQGAALPPRFQHRLFCLHLDRKMLHRRIEARVDEMIAAGLLDECQQLLHRGYSPALAALRTVGYQEPFRYLAGELSQEEMIAEIQAHTRQYAKRQLTWFRKMKDLVWVEAKPEETAAAVAERILNAFMNSLGKAH